MMLTLGRRDIKRDSRKKEDKDLNIKDFNIPCIAIYSIDEVHYINGSYEKKFKTRILDS